MSATRYFKACVLHWIRDTANLLDKNRGHKYCNRDQWSVEQSLFTFVEWHSREEIQFLNNYRQNSTYKEHACNSQKGKLILTR